MTLAEAVPAGHVLVVDDEAANRQLVVDMLEARGHRVRSAKDGEDALRAVSHEAPDVVLLDVTMPGMDGLEVCRRLKEDPATAAIPVLLLTAPMHREERLRGMEAGANDFVTKPFDGIELMLRVRNALRLRRQHAETAGHYRRLQDLERMRDSLVHMAVHDLRTPLTGVKLYLELLRQDDRIARTAPDLVDMVDEAGAIATRMADMINDMLDTSRFEEGAMPMQMADADLAAVVREAVALAHPRGEREVAVTAPETLMARFDSGLMRRVVGNLVGNALDYSGEETPVTVVVLERPHEVEVRVTDQGPGIPAEYHEKIFEKFGQVEAARNHVKHSTGLGLTFCRLAVLAHRGRIGVDSDPGSGSTFWVVLPRNGS